MSFVKAKYIQANHNQSHIISCVSIYLGSKRGVISGVAPMIEDSSKLLAGVIRGFLVDLWSKSKHGFRLYKNNPMGF